MESIFNVQALLALLTLTVLEIVLGIDNIIFISIISQKLPENQQKKGRIVGLLLAMLTRIVLLFSLTWVLGLTKPLVSIFSTEFSGRDFILIGGGLFLLAKSTFEIHEKLEGEEDERAVKVYPSFRSVIIQIMLLDIIFSLDSVITAVGMANSLAVMIMAVVLAVVFMIFFSEKISRFVENHPTIKILALSFLLLIGFTLVADGFGQHIPKGYIYFAMFFSVFVEMINLKMRKKERHPIALHQKYAKQEDAL